MAPRIHLLEDRCGTSRALVELLKSEGFEVESFQNEAEALSASKQRRPDLAILDICTPPPDGVGFARVLHFVLRIPTLVVTRLSCQPMRDSLPRTMGDTVLCGSYNRAEFLQEVWKLLAPDPRQAA